MIPSKLPKGTTLEQWEAYEKELDAHKERMAMVKPCENNYEFEHEYTAALNVWRFESAVDAPNKPGYFRANND